MILELRFEAKIRASPERVFNLLAELREYDQWMPGSAAFHGMARIPAGPIGVGTTYIEHIHFVYGRDAYGRDALPRSHRPLGSTLNNLCD